MQVQAWKNPATRQFGIRIGEVECDAELPAKAKTILIDLDGEVHRFKLVETGYWSRAAIVAGEPFRDWLANHNALEWSGRKPPVFHLVELMVPLGEQRRFKLWA